MSEKNLKANIEQAASLVKKAGALLICAGAGMGVDSGLPDFRGDRGFWKAYPPFARLGLSFIDMANPGWFDRDPELAWGFYGHRLNLYRDTVPHEGFTILKRWGRSKPGGCFVFTSNVDGQFQRTGFEEEEIVECHGSIHHLQCSGPCSESIWPADKVQVTVNETKMKAAPPLPDCPGCGRVARPNILMFGDWHWFSQRSDDQDYRFREWLRRVEADGSELVIVEAGAGTGVPTVRMTAERIAANFKAALIRINVREPQVPQGQIGLAMGALEALQKIDVRLNNLS